MSVHPFALVFNGPANQASLSDDDLTQALMLAPGSAEGEFLADKEAFEILFEADAAAAQQCLENARAQFADRLVDINLIIDDEAREKKLLIADMDSTLIHQECIDEMAAELGIKDQISAITERAMAGELDFETALRARLGLLKGLHISALKKVWDERIKLMDGAKTLVATMGAHGAYTAIVSGGFDFFTIRVREALGANMDHSNILDMDGDILAGDVVGPILGKEAKKAYLLAYQEKFELADDETLAVGDGANDLAMIEAAGLGVAYRAKPVVAAAAGVAINHGDLTALLYLQGIKKGDFV